MSRRASEDELIAKYFAPIAGPDGLGLLDDAACVTPPPGRQLVLTADALVEGGHFFSDDPPDAVARKALRVNLSDLAAKAADPLGFLLTLALPPDWREDWLAAFAQGLGADAERFSCPLLGGDTIRTSGHLSLSVAMIGTVPAGAMTARSGAGVGDGLYVSGSIGDAALGLALRRADREKDTPEWACALSAAQRDELVERYRRPEPRVALRSALRACARAAMDVSDGLVGDAGKMLRASGLGATVDLRLLPLSAAARAALTADSRLLEAIACGGDDYEVLCAVAPAKEPDFVRMAGEAGVPVARIGQTQPGETIFLGLDGRSRRFAKGSFSHF